MRENPKRICGGTFSRKPAQNPSTLVKQTKTEMFKRSVIKLKIIVDNLTIFHILANIRILQYSEKYYIHKEV